MIAYQDGEEAAFKELYRRYSKRVYGYLNKRISDSAKIDDVFQAIFLKLHRSRRRYNPKYRFAPWLFIICRSVLIDAARTRVIYDENRFESISDEHPEGKFPQEGSGTVDLTLLSKEQQEVIKMRYGDDLDYEEMAERLQLSAQTVRKRVSRAIEALRGFLKKT